MNQYLFIFRSEPRDVPPTEEQIKTMVFEWKSWITNIARKGNYSSTNRLIPGAGKTVKPGKMVTDGPYMEAKEVVGGYLIVKANTIDEAVELAKGCPGLSYDSTVEVRPVMNIEYDTASPNFLEEKVLA